MCRKGKTAANRHSRNRDESFRTQHTEKKAIALDNFETTHALQSIAHVPNDVAHGLQSVALTPKCPA